MDEKLDVYTLETNSDVGEVKIADDVVSVIAGLAATEIEGVDSIYGNITNDIVSKLTKKNLAKGVKSKINEDGVVVDITLNVKFGYQIKKITYNVQERVKSSIENMTGLNVNAVNIRIANIVAVKDV